VINNDPELAVFLRDRCPDSFIAHCFHSVMECKPVARNRFKSAVTLAMGVSDFTSRWAEDYYEMPKRSIHTVYNGVDLMKFYPAPTPISSDPVVVNYVGRLGIEKAPDLLLRAAIEIADRVPPFAIHIAGSNAGPNYELDSYQQELHDMSGQLRLRGVEVSFAGHIAREEVPRVMRRAHISVMPSRCEEAFGMATLEGMACGLATIASNTGGTAEVVGDAGLLFEREDVGGLAAHLKSLLIDENLRAEYSRRGPERARRFGWDQAWSRLATTLVGNGCDLHHPVVQS
jgi:glycosyltransferase involved in cell wall biosynthesis